jgi:hypothetical protein
MLLCKDGTHWISWIDHKYELSLFADKLLGILKINLKVLIFSEFVRNGLDPKCRTYVSEERVAHLRH